MGIFRGSTLSGDALANIDIVADNIDNVNTVGTNIASVNAVAGDIGDVTTVAGIAADVGVVASIATEITGINASDVSTVAGIDSDVTTVAGISSNVTTVAGMSANISSIIANETNINLVAADIADVATVAEDIADVMAVAAIDSDVTTVAGIDSDVTTVAGIAPAVSNVSSISTAVSNVNSNATNINTVAGISSNVSTVAGIAANVTTVAGISANVTSVASNSTNINTVATNIANVNSVGTNIANVNSVAGNATNINAVAGNATNINTVAGISANVTTVATNNANVTTVATNIASVNTNATNIANINQNAANITAIQNASANATAAANSATAAASSATSAATSAAQASAVALGNEPVRHSVRPSLLLDFANTKTLDPRITFTRGSTGTFYDGKTVAKAEENLLVRSQEFESGSWASSGFNTSVTANSTTAPDGTATADTITGTGATLVKRILQTVTLTSGTYTFSVFAKAGTHSFIQFFYSGTGTDIANFDLSTGTAGTVIGSSTITSFGNGWYRCTHTFTANANTFANIALVDSNTAARSASTASTGTIYLWGAQLEQRSSVTAYTATTTAPITNYIPALQTAASGVARFEHNPVTGESLGLEIEEQRTNLLTYSEQFNDAAWSKTELTVSANAGIAPDGTLTADRLIESTTASAAHVIFAAAGSAAAHSMSFYLKPFGRSWVNLRIDGTSNYFNISTGALGTIASGNTASITSVGNGWYRCSVTRTMSGSGAVGFRLAIADNTDIYTGDGWSGVLVWGAQLEAGSFATSYIKTEGSQVTRSADSASMTGANFSSWYRADEGTLYAAYIQPSVVSAQVASLNDNTAGNRVSLRAGSFPDLLIQTNSTTVAQVSASTGSSNTLVKSAGVYRVNDAQVSINGLLSLNDSSLTLPIVNQMTIGSITSTSFVNGSINKIAYYPRRLTNAELQSLTTV